MPGWCCRHCPSEHTQKWYPSTKSGGWGGHSGPDIQLGRPPTAAPETTSWPLSIPSLPVSGELHSIAVWYTVVFNHRTNYLNAVLTVVVLFSGCCRFESAEPGSGFAKMSNVDEEERFCLLRDPVATVPTPADLPGEKATLGLSQVRQPYLYREIRPFVDEATADLIAPKPPSAQHETKRRRQTGDSTGH